jgi:putative ABC transport system permease protein
MVPIARRNLLSDRVKLLVAIGGVTLAIVLILVVQSLYYGVRREGDTFVRQLPGDVWITQQGTTDLVFSNSHLPTNGSTNLCSSNGVHTVHNLSGRLMSFTANGKEVRTYVMALDRNCGDEVPEQFVPEEGSIYIDKTFARQIGLSEGDSLEFNDDALTVSDVRPLGNVLVTQFAWINAEDYRRLFGVPDSVNFFLVGAEETRTAESLLQPLAAQIDGSSSFTTEDFANRSSAKTVGDFLPIIRVIMVIGFIVGLAVLSLTIYSATIERSREYAVMKVMGASPFRLYRIVLSQSAFIATLGFAAGVGLAYVFNQVAGDFVPQFITYIRPRDIAFVLGVTVIMSFVASYLPISRVARMQPASVFRA